ncbi:MAG: sigma 54-interacting transcriptional regulator [Rhodospirillales bacterium]|nr:sigma 54-interacting transcriptional regulator [Rhodospirillales bacterium]
MDAATAPQPHAAGLAVVDRRDRLLHAYGVAAAVPRLRSIVTDAAWLADLRRRRLSTLALDDRRWLILLLRLRDADLLVFADTPTDAVFEFVAAVDFCWDILNHLVTDPFDAMTVVDAEGRVAFISPVHEAFFGLGRGEAIGRPVQEVIENTRLHRVLATGKAEIGQVQRMRGLDRIVSRVPIRRDGQVLGAVGRVMFKGPDQVEALSRRVNALEREVAFYRREAAALRERDSGLVDIIGESPPVARLRGDIARVAPLDVPVLVHGASGTGKELVARALHSLSPRRAGPLVAVNAAALPAGLVESELFGYAPGAFTGADRKGRKGRFEQAQGGTIFLDEIGDTPPETQAKLLRVLQDRRVERVGGDGAVGVDFRLVCATNRDLRALVADGRFRLDLYYRITTVVLEVPRLAERPGDVPLLARHFLRELAERHRLPVPEVDAEAMARLGAFEWPGNVRQLRQAIERALIFAEGGRLRAGDFADLSETPASGEVHPRAAAPAARLRDAVDQAEAAMVREAMRRLRGNKRRVAAELGVSRSWLYKRLAELADAHLPDAAGPENGQG